MNLRCSPAHFRISELLAVVRKAEFLRNVCISTVNLGDFVCILYTSLNLGDFVCILYKPAFTMLFSSISSPQAPPPPEPTWEERQTSVIHLAGEDFRESLKKKRHALVMFYAPCEWMLVSFCGKRSAI